MTEQLDRTDYAGPHPRLYRPKVSTFWWLRRPSYVRFVLRELSSVFVAWFVVYLLLLIRAVRTGEDDYRRFLDWADTWWVVLLNVVALAFVLFHSVTWFNLAPAALVVRLRGRPVPASLVAAGHFAAWAVLSAVVAWIVLVMGS